MGLQVKRTGSADYGFYVKALVCGEPGSGKTKTAATWPNPLYANAEGGLMSVAAQNIPTVDVTNLGVLLELKNALDQPPAIREKMLGVPVDTVIIDTLDEVARIAIKDRLEHTNKDAMAIADWGWLGEQLRALVRAYRNLPLNVIFNCHLKSVEDAESGTQYLKPAIQGAMGDEMAGYVDIATVLTARPITEVINGKNHRRIIRIMQTFPDLKRPWIKDRSGKLPMEFPINFEDDYKRLHELIYGDIIEAQPEVQQTIVQPAPAPAPAPESPDDASLVAEAAEAVTAAVHDVVGSVKEVVVQTIEQPKKKARAKKEEAVVEPEVTPPAPAAPVEPEPAPETPVPTPEPEVSTAPDGLPAEEPAAAPEAPVKEPWETCATCGGQIDSKDQADLSYIRFRKYLCRTDFAAARKR